MIAAVFSKMFVTFLPSNPEHMPCTVRLISLLLLLLANTGTAQSVSDVHARQVEQQIVIEYNLSSSDDLFVELYYSRNNGRNWLGPIQNVYGNTGHDARTGLNKATWDVLTEVTELVGDEIKFKVKATPAMGKVSFSTDTDMTLTVGGKQFSVSPGSPKVVSLPPGSHRVDVTYRSSNYKKQTRKKKVNVIAGREKNVRYSASGMELGTLGLKIVLYGGIIGVLYVLSAEEESP